MGYTTDFDGSMEISPPLTPERVSYINKFSETRRMKRDPQKASKLHDPLREAVGLPIGEDGCYFVGGSGGYDKDGSIVEHNYPPANQPGLWCQWIVSEDGSSLEWDFGEKFYAYEDWLNYIQDHFLTPWGSKLNGKIDWCGEDRDDMGVIYAKDGMVEAVVSTIRNIGPSWER